MATITKKNNKWYVQIRRSFHKPIYKSFIAKADALRWSRETERLIEVGEFLEQPKQIKLLCVNCLNDMKGKYLLKKELNKINISFEIFADNLLFIKSCRIFQKHWGADMVCN